MPLKEKANCICKENIFLKKIDRIPSIRRYQSAFKDKTLNFFIRIFFI